MVTCSRDSFTLHTFLQDAKLALVLEKLGMQVDVQINDIVLVLHADLLLGVQATK
jgi:hypothetical protein